LIHQYQSTFYHLLCGCSQTHAQSTDSYFLSYLQLQVVPASSDIMYHTINIILPYITYFIISLA